MKVVTAIGTHWSLHDGSLLVGCALVRRLLYFVVGVMTLELEVCCLTDYLTFLPAQTSVGINDLNHQCAFQMKSVELMLATPSLWKRCIIDESPLA